MENNQLIPWEEVGRWHQKECRFRNAFSEDERKLGRLDWIWGMPAPQGKKFWESQELREDGDDQLIRTNAVLKNIVLVALRRDIMLNSVCRTAECFFLLTHFHRISFLVCHPYNSQFCQMIKEWGTQGPRKYLLLRINPCCVTSLNKEGFVCNFERAWIFAQGVFTFCKSLI